MLWQLFIIFFKIGLFTFGGGYAMVPLIQEEICQRGWMTDEKLIELIAVCESTPGSLAVNMATYLGLQMSGIAGAIVCTIGVVTPAFIIICIISNAFERFKESRIIQAVMKGLKPAVVALIFVSAVSIFKTIFIGQQSIKQLISGIVFVVALLCGIKKVNSIFIIVLSAGLSIILSLLWM